LHNRSSPDDIQWSILADKDCRIESRFCSFIKEKIALGLHSYYESSYDTFLHYSEGIITSNVSCRAVFSHVTFVSSSLFTINLFEGFDFRNLKEIWIEGKPRIHFSDSIVLVNGEFKPELWFTSAGKAVNTYDGASIMNLVDEGILSSSEINLLNIPPTFLCQDPLLILENNVARLSPNSPAIKSASDGTNLGAWQGD
jgi:hypothetical protein